MGYKAWRTPTKPGSIYANLLSEFEFTMDAASSHINHLLPTYCTESGKYNLKVDVLPLQLGNEMSLVRETTRTQLSDFSGLAPENWAGESVFANPPYDQSIVEWIDVANTAPHRKAALLLLASIDTAWFHHMWPDHATLISMESHPKYHSVVFHVNRQVREIRFHKGRERFLRPKTMTLDPVTQLAIPNENDPESVPGDAPRAGNIVYIVRNL